MAGNDDATRKNGQNQDDAQSREENAFAEKINAFGADADLTEARTYAGTSAATDPDAALKNNDDFDWDPEATEWRRGFADTEFAAEAAPEPITRPPAAEPKRMNGNERNNRIGSATLGWVALILAVAALFVWPAVLGPAGAVVGFFAYMRGSRALGVWSIAIGLIAFIAYVVITPFYS
ncbi:MAG TPA: hypothetical protein VF260_07150 [Bacilli bacterium]